VADASVYTGAHPKPRQRQSWRARFQETGQSGQVRKSGPGCRRAGSSTLPFSGSLVLALGRLSVLCRRQVGIDRGNGKVGITFREKDKGHTQFGDGRLIVRPGWRWLVVRRLRTFERRDASSVAKAQGRSVRRVWHHCADISNTSNKRLSQRSIPSDAVCLHWSICSPPGTGSL
jgi:hypothetical protein